MPVRPGACLAMYSSLVEGIVTDPTCMQVPVDDHLVHRGDGVFETCKSVQRGVYNLPAHLKRLACSSEEIGIHLQWGEAELTHILCETLRAAGRPDATIRILVSRGPGGMGVNPLECESSQLYVVVYPLARSFMEAYPQGARIGYSRVPPKPPPFARIKHCNYLPNALMAKEARERGLDFVLGTDAAGNVLEGATENIAMVDQEGSLCSPDGAQILPGTTISRLFELAEPLCGQGLIHGIRRMPLTRTDLEAAREVFMVGTTHDIVAVKELEDRPSPHGAEGPVFNALRKALTSDVRTNRALRTEW